MMQVKDLANQTDVPAHVIRYYTQIGLLTPMRNPVNRYRDYETSDVARVNFIRGGRWLGFTLQDLGAILCDVDNGVSPCAEVREVIEQRARRNRQHLDQFARLQAGMEEAIGLWETKPAPDHASLRFFVDAVAGMKS